MNHERASLV